MSSEWNQYTQFKDTVHGYISVFKPIAQEIINTEVFQRLKHIEQTGMRVLYPSATHDRFTHSLGVYHLGISAFSSFRKNIKSSYNYIYKEIGEEKWDEWNILFLLACLLHDCAHSPFSHTLEFIYDLQSTEISNRNKNLNLDSKKIKNNIELVENVELINPGGKFRDDFYYKEGNRTLAYGQPHEKMSANFVCTYFKNKIEWLVDNYMQNIYKQNNDTCGKKYFYKSDLEFIVRMIIGCNYSNQGNDSWLELQVKNCIISLLNSSIDVDNLDYTLRDTKFSGYENSQVDLERLINSFTIVTGKKYESEVIDKVNINNSVDCECFEGTLAKEKLNLHGKCKLESLLPINARGNLSLGNELNNNTELKRKFFYAEEGFSAELSSGDLNDAINFSITPYDSDKAYIYISGKLEGTFTGVIWDNKDFEKAKDIPLISFAYDKSSLSVIQSAVDARNYEYKWIYAHHTITYQIRYLIIHMLELYANCLYYQEVEDIKKEIEALGKACEQFKTFKTEQCDTIFPVYDSHKSLREEFEDLKSKIITYMQTSLLVLLETSIVPDDSIEETLRYMEDDPLKALNDIQSKTNNSIHIMIIKYRTTAQLITQYSKNPSLLSNYVIGGFKWLYTILRSKNFTQGDHLDIFARSMLRLILGEKVISENFRNFFSAYQDVLNRFYDEEIQYMIDIVSVPGKHQIGTMFYNMSSDEDLLAGFKQLRLQIEEKEPQRSVEHEFLEISRQYFARDFCNSMWKTYAQFKHMFRNWTLQEINYLNNSFFIKKDNLSVLTEDGRLNFFSLSENTNRDYLKSNHQLNIFYEFLKDHKIKRFTWVKQEIKTKQLNPHKTFIKYGESVLRLNDIELIESGLHNKEFFYFYYRMENEEKLNLTDITKIIYKLKTCIEKSLKSESYSHYLYPKQKEVKIMKINDPIYGGISIPKKFAQILNTPEFQRLRRIKQLATANLVFPSATHTRFEHSIGVFYLMQKIINHFEEYFESIGIDINKKYEEIEESWQETKDAALAAALLHDVGHGPFSHAFEHIMNNSDKKNDESKYTHEKMTIRIITEKESGINECLKKEFGEAFPEKVVKFIEKRIKHKETSSENLTKTDFWDLEFIFSSLVSSQLDADRMDYMLRDARAANVPYTNFSLERLIEGMHVIIMPDGNDSKACVCIKEKYISEVENYLLSRYLMYSNIYYNSFKLYSEKLLNVIIKRAFNIYKEAKIRGELIPYAIKNIFDYEPLSINDFNKLDDHVIMGAISTWSMQDEDLTLKFLSEALLNRDGFTKLPIFFNDSEIDYVKKAIFNIIKGLKTDTTQAEIETFFEESYFWIEEKRELGMYTTNARHSNLPNKELEILILKNDGSVEDLSKVSWLLGLDANKEDTGEDKEENKEIHRKSIKIYYINYKILSLFLEESGVNDMEKKEADIKEEIRSCTFRNILEIETKYVILKEDVFEDFSERLKEICAKLAWDTGDSSAKSQEDIYYDYADRNLTEASCSMRIRKVENNYNFTYKKPKEDKTHDNQVVRYEYELELPSDDLVENRQIIINRYPELNDVIREAEHPEKILKVENKRQKFIIKQKEKGDEDFYIELVLDDVTYRDPEDIKQSKEKQIEIELGKKVDYKYRLKLNEFTQLLEKEFAGKISSINDSKLERGLAKMK